MNAEETLAATGLNTWKIVVGRAGKMFSALSDDQLRREIAPGKNRLVYLWGHLIAVHDRMLPLLGVGERLHPELDQRFIFEADSKSDEVPDAETLKRLWDEVNGALLSALEKLSPSEWLAPHTAVSADDFAANPLRNRLSVVLNRSTHVDYHLGQAALLSNK